MPPKKPIRRNNKKKKGSGGVESQQQPPSNTSRPSPQREPLRQIPASFHSNPSTTPRRSSPTAGGMYNVYKRATQCFRDGLKRLVPTEIFAQDRVDALMSAADFIVEHKISIPAVLLENCSISLSLRKQYSKRMEGMGDIGHEYFIDILDYCYESLKPLVSRVQRKANKAKARQFRFTDFQIPDSDDDEEEEEQQQTVVAPIPRPKQPLQTFTFEDLIKGTDRLQAIVFLDSVDRAMEEVARAYKTLKANMQRVEIQEPQEAAYLIDDLMEAAVVVNFNIRQVQLMEEELQLDHPHLTTSYRILACIFLVDNVDELNKIAIAAGKSVPKTEMTAFLGDVVESAFRNHRSDPQNRISELTASFCRKCSMPLEQITSVVEGTVIQIHVEIQPDSVVQDPEFESMLQSFGLTSHSWMKHKTFIGGNRSILNTQRLVQGLSNLLTATPPTKLILKPGAFGALWDEKRRLATKIQGDMDQLLLGDILPELLISCKEGPFSQQIPGMDELFPFFKLLRQYVDNPTKPVPLSLTFGVHAILTSIFELQGYDRVGIITNASKCTYNHYFDQLQQQLESTFPCSTIWRTNLKRMIFGRFIPAIVGPPVNERAEDRAFWNPCCGGMLLSFVCFEINLDGGAVMIDSFAQLRLVLHLYNALQQRNLISGNIPLLTSLDKFFEGVRAIWEGEKPNRENLVKRFWLAYGTRADLTRHLHEDCRRMVLNALATSGGDVMETRNGNATRELTPCNPQDFSKSYRRIYLGDFTGMVDRYLDHHSNLENVPAWRYNHTVRMNDALDMMTSEEELLSWNLIAVGGVLNEFIYFLMDRLGWKQFVDFSVATLPTGDRRMDGRRLDPRSFVASDAYKERSALVTIFANKLLGPLEFLDSVEHDPVLTETRDCIIEYFTTLDPMKYQFFGSIYEGKGPMEAVASPLLPDCEPLGRV